MIHSPVALQVQPAAIAAPAMAAPAASYTRYLWQQLSVLSTGVEVPPSQDSKTLHGLRSDTATATAFKNAAKKKPTIKMHKTPEEVL
jgi:hypothetical protein